MREEKRENRHQVETGEEAWLRTDATEESSPGPGTGHVFCVLFSFRLGAVCAPNPILMILPTYSIPMLLTHTAVI